jgi:hypothetical protein
MSRHVGYIVDIKGHTYLSKTKLSDPQYKEQRLYTEDDMIEVVNALQYTLSKVGGHLGREEKWVIEVADKYKEALNE